MFRRSKTLRESKERNGLRPVKRSWQEIAEETSHEQDSAKLKQLSVELARALDERDKQRHPPRLTGPTIPTVANTLQVERLGNVKDHSVLCLKGPLTVENVSLFQSAIRREESSSPVILDLSDVPYIDSTALGALVSAYVSRQKVGRRVALSGVSERVSKMLKITSVESLFLTFPTLEDAIDGLTGAGVA